MRVGPYTVSAVLSGFRKDEQANIPVTLGEQRSVEFSLKIESIAETIEVIGQSSIIDSSRAGTADNISSQAVQSLPTISRNIVDIARTSPYFNPAGLNEDPLGAVGRRPEQPLQQPADRRRCEQRRVRSRAPRATPGGTAEAQPISLDADPGDPAGGVAVRRAAGRFLWRRHQRHHQERLERVQGHGVSLRPQPGLGGRGPERHEDRSRSRTSSAAAASAGRSCRTRRSSLATSTTDARRTTRRAFRSTERGQQFGRSAEVDRLISILEDALQLRPGRHRESSSARSTATSSSCAVTSTSTRATS